MGVLTYEATFSYLIFYWIKMIFRDKCLSPVSIKRLPLFPRMGTPNRRHVGDPLD